MQNSKQFVVDRIVDQARREGVALTDIEIRMLKFTEEPSNSKDLEAAAIFDRDYYDEEYEKKIANLVRHAYERDKQSGNQDSWDDPLVHLACRDLYLNVTIERAGVNRDTLGFLGDGRFVLYGVVPVALCLTAAVVIGFSPIGAHFIRSDALRLVVTICILIAPCLILRSSKNRHQTARKAPVK